MRILFKNATIVTMNAEREVIKGDLLVDGSQIAAVGGVIDQAADQIIDLKGDLLIPGLIQTHIHLCQTLFRGQGDDLELLDWLKLRIWPLEGGHDPESIYDSALLGIGELFLGGTTTIVDMETVHHTEHAFEAILSSGLRALSGKVMMDDCNEDIPPSLRETTEASLQESVDLLEKYHGKGNGRLEIALTPRFVISCTDTLLKEVSRLAREKNVFVHTHASENRSEIQVVESTRGMRNIVYLDQVGLTGPNLIIAHCIWLDEVEKEILVKSRTRVSHCPSSNLKLASGIAPIPELLKLGAEVSLSADGAPCNNNLDGFREMRHAALIQKPLHGPTVMPAREVFELATLGGARAIGHEHDLGSLEVGKNADLAVVTLQGLHTWPIDHVDVYSQLVYQATSSDVRLTMVDGQIVMKDRQLLTIDVSKLKLSSTRSLNRVMKRVGLL
ncbi:cytosine deaminase-like metal-dependent hydrolase [Desulfosporosinus orientis DSM 765]|uniref:Cytosine deaminase-like metal-dependent hydrolase n=1 Tax=Desulfosporosinus orientis (strain ATCC 19365 / DSM 765 / NCIMB 8382 / VKM B-1628 / Singapore I) TaxID=768706 RepID=G7W8A6_DESOD|nr:5'-deoxyadenosine deaminase [Desulfosporosinus orientis]AET67046.1 cytosine deaminase-like metal-dependent hydrolase [Desulfosporosinus orientis DSM 765]